MLVVAKLKAPGHFFPGYFQHNINISILVNLRIIVETMLVYDDESNSGTL